MGAYAPICKRHFCCKMLHRLFYFAAPTFPLLTMLVILAHFGCFCKPFASKHLWLFSENFAALPLLARQLLYSAREKAVRLLLLYTGNSATI